MIEILNLDYYSFLYKVLLNDKVIEIVKSLIGENITYFGDSGWNITSEIITQITNPFRGIITTYALIKTIND